MRQIPLYVGRGHKPTEMFAMVDEGDYERLSRYAWAPRLIGGIVYAIRHEGSARPNTHRLGYSKADVVLMHREVMDAPPGTLVDHVNRCGIDNRRENLRFTGRQGNAANAKKKEGTSRFKGVYWDNSRGKWMARIHVNYGAIFLGRFSDEVEAAKTYDAAARRYFGAFARPNFEV